MNIEYPNFGGANYKFIVALCDSSLMSFHPAQMFFNTIERMKKENFSPKNCKEIYDFAFKATMLKGEIGEFTANSLFEKVIDDSIKQYHNALKSPIFLEIYDWLNHILIQAKKLRLENPDFLCNLLDSRGNLTDAFYDIFRKLGSPFFTNNKNEGGFVPPTNLNKKHSRPFQLLVFKEILRVYFGEKSCSMINFCRLWEKAILMAPISFIKIELNSADLVLLKNDKDNLLICLNNLVRISVTTFIRTYVMRTFPI